MFGAHVSTGGRGLAGAIPGALATGSDAVQIFGSNPRGWALPRLPGAAEAAAFRADWAAAGLGPLFLHAPYVVNPGSPNERFRARSGRLLAATVELAERLGAEGVVVHAGAGGAGVDHHLILDRVAETLTQAITRLRRTRLLIELSAGGAGSAAATFPQARALLRAAGGDPGLGLCADTCHLFAAGYELDSPDGVRACFDELRRLGLVRRLRLLHANDALADRGSHRDRHARIGRGLIGEAGFAAILAHPAVRRVPVICETPGDPAAHAEDVRLLRRLAG